MKISNYNKLIFLIEKWWNPRQFCNCFTIVFGFVKELVRSILVMFVSGFFWKISTFEIEKSTLRYDVATKDKSFLFKTLERQCITSCFGKLVKCFFIEFSRLGSRLGSIFTPQIHIYICYLQCYNIDLCIFSWRANKKWCGFEDSV